MNKSVRIQLLVITTVVAIFAFTGIWYLRPGVPNELLEQARARQLQPLLEIEAPIRKPVAQPVAQPAVDKEALAKELLPTLTEQVARSLEGPLYEKLKKGLASDEAFFAQISAKLEETLNVGVQTPEVPDTPAIPQGLRSDFAEQVEALRTELLAMLADGQSSFFFQIEDMLDARLGRFEKDLDAEMQEYVPQLVDRMIPTLVEMLVTELDANKATYLPYLARDLKPLLVESITEEELVLLYTAYRDQIVADLVPVILTAMEEPAKKEVAEMVKTLKAPVAPVPPPPQSVTSVVKRITVVEPKLVPKLQEPVVAPEVVVPMVPTIASPKSVVVKAEPVVEPEIVVPMVPTIASPKSVVVKAEPVVEPVVMVPKVPTIATPKSVVVKAEPVVEPVVMVPKVPTIATPKSVVVKAEPILTAPVFITDEPEVFVDPVSYEEKRTEIRTKAIQEVLDRINAL
ncbi:MAG: hypothetical protein JEY71_06705 [Sphaerochaeta sp.]|nr:hypothetical protein [Sphaerochaeta sp.]